MEWLYKKLNYSKNPDFEYQRRNGIWFRRKKGTLTAFVKGDENVQKVLNNAYKDKSPLFFYSETAVIGGLILLGSISYYGYLKFYKR